MYLVDISNSLVYVNRQKRVPFCGVRGLRSGHKQFTFYCDTSSGSSRAAYTRQPGPGPANVAWPKILLEYFKTQNVISIARGPE